MTLRHKLTLPTLALAAIMAVAGGWALWDWTTRSAALQAETHGVRLATGLAISLHEAAAEEGSRVSAIRTDGESTQEARLRRASARVEELLVSFRKARLPPRPAGVLAQVVETRASLRTVHAELVAAAQRGDAAGVERAAGKSRLLAARGDALLEDLVGYHLRALDRTVDELERRSVWLLRGAGPALGIGLLLAVLSAFWVARVVVRSIVATAVAAETIAESGSLSRVGGAARRDEIGILARSFNRMTERLLGANAQLAEADRRKNEFLAMLSHEMRNPLAPIRSSLHVLRHAPPGGEQAGRALAVLDRQVGHLTRLVDDLLDVTRIVRGKITVRRDRVDFAEVARRTAEDHAALLRSKRLEFRVEVPAGPLPVLGDATRLAQVIGNLLTNAVKFTGAGGRVTLSLRADGDAAELCVRDTGIGMPADLLLTIFEPFVQADQSLARTEGGLGLGLALVKSLVELHGGSVRADSAGAGAGSELVVRLPLAPADAAGQARDERAAAGAAARAAARRVLVVDDNQDAARGLADVAELFGHQVVRIAHDGPSALAAARDERPDVVLCDIGLPGMSGLEVARALRAELGPGVLLVAVSGYTQADDVRASAEAGFDRHLAKPVDPDELARVLGGAGPPERGRHPAGRQPAALE